MKKKYYIYYNSNITNIILTIPEWHWLNNDQMIEKSIVTGHVRVNQALKQECVNIKCHKRA